ncbi:hypothetical protein [Laspinema olomoucense]|uniref:hypothetical protein n=1 Tax=Laspinema olomoucense TaxID=3231600 RepID=UPI0021BAE670|nr:hypothetical protein [Laspinema sp. D3c]MCT7995703.1 hypothetical protein [Laspinema sp. D3c]
MTDKRIRAYIKLIQKLLDCPEGDELKILRKHRHLIDVQFLYVLNQAAEKAEEEGEEDTASFLRTLSEQLELAFAEIVKRTHPAVSERNQAYLQIIEEILKCDTGEEVAHILHQNSERVDRGFVKTLAQVAQLMVENGQPDSAAVLIDLATVISSAIEEG